MCSFKDPPFVNDLVHTIQEKDFSPECDIMCSFKFPPCLKIWYILYRETVFPECIRVLLKIQHL